jgi:hypothetical protein
MNIRLIHNATRVAIYKTICVGSEYVDTTRKSGKRSIQYTESFKVAEFPVYESTEMHLAGQFPVLFRKATVNGEEEVTRVFEFDAQTRREAQEWINAQMRGIDTAFRNNMLNGLQGGTPVIKRHIKKDRETWGHHPEFDDAARIGEFTGVIRDALPVTATKLLSTTNAHKSSTREAFEAGDYDNVTMELVEMIIQRANDKGQILKRAYSKKEKEQLYFAKRVLELVTIEYYALDFKPRKDDGFTEKRKQEAKEWVEKKLKAEMV